LVQDFSETDLCITNEPQT